MLLKSGTDVFTLMKLSGHKDIESLKPYIRLSNEDAQQAHKRNSPVERLFA
jgi:integrase/recombinase XerD